MSSMLRIGVCMVALAVTASTAALADDTMKKPMHHGMMHKGMMHKGMMHKGMMSKMGGKSEGDAAVAKLNDQSLQQAKAGAAPASTMPMAPASTMPMAPASTGSMAPPAAMPK